MTLQTISGDFISALGAAEAARRVTFRPTMPVWTNGSAIVVGEEFVVTADGSGQATVDVEPGRYIGVIALSYGNKTFTMSVGTEGPYDWAEVVNEAPPEAVAGLVQQAANYALLAQQWAANPEDDTVPGGGGLYSALHYAAKTADDRTQTGLDAVATAADRVQTGLDATATAADRVQTGLDAVATAADRVQTGIDAGVATAAAASALATAAAVPALEKATEDALTSPDLEATVTLPTGRAHNPIEGAQAVVTPLFAGLSLDDAVTPVSVTVVGKNIVNPLPSLWEVGTINTSGVNATSGSSLRTIDYIPVQAETQYVRSWTGIGGKPVVTLYDASGTFTRQIAATVGIADTWTTTADEVQMRVTLPSITSAIPANAFDARAQIEKGPVASTFEAYRAVAKSYVATDLYAHGSVADTIEGNYLVRRILRRTLQGTADTGVFNIGSTIITSVSGYYGAQIQSPLDFVDGVKSILVGRCDDGDFVQNAASTTAARGIWISAALARIFVDTATIDAQVVIDPLTEEPIADPTTFEKFEAYLDAHPVEVIFDRGSWATSQEVATGMIVLPEDGSILTVATGATEADIRFREISAGGGGGGAALESRVTTLEGTATSHGALLTGLQSQINDLVVEGDSSVEAAQARTSAFGLASATLKARLDQMDLTIGQVDVRMFGAVGDGMTDDTQAFLDARDIAEANNMALYIPPCASAYMLRRGVRLHKSTRVKMGAGSGWVKKFPAATSDVTEAVTVGQTVIPVADASLFTVGFDIYVGPPDSGLSYNGTRGVITAVDTVGDTVTIAAYTNPDGPGMRIAFAEGEAVASTTFPLFYTDSVVSGAATIISPELIGLRLDGNRQSSEANSYPCSLIHLDKQHVEAPLVMRCNLINSPADAVSDQSNGMSVLAYNRSRNCRYHGLHIGYTNDGTLLLGNHAEENGLDGVYYCFGNTNTLTVLNTVKDCPIGFNEIGGQEDGDTILANNTTIGCGQDYVISNLQQGMAQIVGFQSIGCTGNVVFGNYMRRARIQGLARGGSGTGIYFTGGTEIDIDVSFFDWTGPYCYRVAADAVGRRSQYVSIRGQAHGATLASVLVESSDDVFVALSHSVPGAGADDIIIGAVGAQATAARTHLAFGIRRGGGVVDGGTGTVDAMAA